MSAVRRAVRWSARAVAVFAAAGGLAWWARADDSGDPDRRWAAIARGDLVETVPFTGELEAVESILLGPPSIPETWEFKIADLAPEGAPVAAGAPVVRFDTEELERKLAEKGAERDAAEQEIEKKRSELELSRGEADLALAEAEARLRKAELAAAVPAELSGRIELDAARIDLDLARTEVEYRRTRRASAARQGAAELGSLIDKRDRAAARVREVVGAIERMTLSAPRAGTVIYVADRQGQKKRIGDTCWPMQKVVEIPDLSRLRARGEVEEADVGRLAVGQVVRMALDALPDLPLSGRIEAIDRAVRDDGEPSSSTAVAHKVVEVEVAVDGKDLGAAAGRMRPGMRLRGTIEVARARGVVLLPAEALFPSADGPRAFRRRLLGIDEVRPKLGRRNTDRFEVLSGLAVGDRVALFDPEEPGT